MSGVYSEYFTSYFEIAGKAAHFGVNTYYMVGKLSVLVAMVKANCFSHSTNGERPTKIPV